MSQNGQTHFKNLAANFQSASDRFWILYIKGLKAVIRSNSLISAGLDNDIILYFIFYRKIPQIYPKFSRNRQH